MLNLQIGTHKVLNGRNVIETGAGRYGHAVYGPYDAIEPGRYVVDFHVAPISLPLDDNEIVTVLDVTRDPSAEVIASREIRASALRSGAGFFTLEFSVEEPAIIETRASALGNARLEIDDYSPRYRIASDADPVDICTSRRFPVVSASSPSLLSEFEPSLRRLHSFGFTVSIVDGNIVLEKDGVRFLARTWDDMNLVEEIFVEDVYRFDIKKNAVLVDVGMNIGLVAMKFAGNSRVTKVYSYEPFEATYKRAADNLALNPALASKIEAINAGVSVKDGIQTFNIFGNSDSGSQSMRDAEGGTPIDLRMVDAATAFGRAIDEAEKSGAAVIAKIDCEGGEFEIIKRLAETGLLNRITAVMVEWHRVFKGRTQAELIAPLRDAGFLIFDRPPARGNGFFYAVRTA